MLTSKEQKRAAEEVTASSTFISKGTVIAGNVETSQRITDVVLGALAQAAPDRIPAASSGTMNNLSFGGVTASGNNAIAVSVSPPDLGKDLTLTWVDWNPAPLDSLPRLYVEHTEPPLPSTAESVSRARERGWENFQRLARQINAAE